MKKAHRIGTRILSLCLSLAILCVCLPGAVLAKTGGLTFASEVCVFSISKESFVREASALASPDECGKDEFITLRMKVTNSDKQDAAMTNPCVAIDGGAKLAWKSASIKAGQTAYYHIYYVNAKNLMPGLHTAVFYESDKPVYTCRFSIGRAWSKDFKFPTEEQIAARPADERSPYLAGWFSIGKDVRYDAYCVDFKSDYIPYGTYSSLFNGYMDYSSLEKQYASVRTDGISLYGGLQQGAEGKESNSILSFWDVYCTDAAGKTTTIRAERTYPAEKTGNDSFGGEGTGAHYQPPYEWKAGQWYRMLLKCGTSEKTGSTTVEQWFQDLTTGVWTHICTYDTGVKNSAFLGNAAVFSENFRKQYAGGVRSLEVANVRIHTGEGWRDVETLSYICTQTSGVHAKAYGSWQAGADEHSFYMITSGVAGTGRKDKTETLTVRNTASGDPLKEIAALAAKK